jgi:hypothetical protein
LYLKSAAKYHSVMRIQLILSLILMCSAFAWGAEQASAPRAARSVHLSYPAPEADAFYNEVTVERSAPGSYFMACGFRHGYFGMQEQTGQRKVVLFSIWDPTSGNDAKNVPPEQRVEVLHQDADVVIKRFGGEGTGAQCFLKYDWQIGETCRFFVRAAVEAEKTAYAAYFYLPQAKQWKHLATFRTRTGGERLKGFYSFIEDFRRDTKSAAEVRRATFANAWVLAGEWKPLLTARFTASNSQWEAKDSIDCGIASNAFFLQTGGDTKMNMAVGGRIERALKDKTPPVMPGD